jgi:hypothetical protein
MGRTQRVRVAVGAAAMGAFVFLPVAAGAASATTGPPTSAPAAARAALGRQHSTPIAGRELRGGVESTTDATSGNWSGYADVPTPAGKKFDNVVGSWTEPAVTCTTDENQVAVFWVGLDGFSDATVEQDGTVAECYEGSAYYFTWWEMYPTNDITVVGSKVAPGDKITASVVYEAGNKRYTLAVTDATRKANSFSVVESCAKGLKCANSSADWIGEAPSSSRGLYPLPDFGTWTVTGGEAAEGTTKASISHFNNDEITMESSAGYPLATPSALSDKGESFTDTWDNSY